MSRQRLWFVILVLLLALTANGCVVATLTPVEAPQATTPTSPTSSAPTVTRPQPTALASPTGAVLIGPRPPSPHASPAPRTPVPASSFVPLTALDSFTLQTVLRTTGPGVLEEEVVGTYTYRREPPAQHFALSGGATSAEPQRIEMIQLGNETYVDMEGSGNWQPLSEDIHQVLAGLNLQWLLDPQALIGSVSLQYAGADMVNGASASRYVAEASALADIPALGDIQEPQGEMTIWVSDAHATVLRVVADIAGAAPSGEPVSLYLETAVTSINEPVDIALPTAEQPTPSPEPTIAGFTIDLEGLARVEGLPAYRLYLYYAEQGTQYLSAEVLHELQQEPYCERLVSSAQLNEQITWSEMVQVRDTAWADEKGNGEWRPMDRPINQVVDIGGILPKEALAPLSRIGGQLVGDEEVHGLPAGHYRWTKEQLAGEYGEEESILNAQADAWISSEHNLLLKLLLYVESEANRVFLQYALTDIGEEIAIPAPADSPCPEARSLALHQQVTLNLTPGGAACFKFVGLEGEPLTLAATAGPGSALDPQIAVYDHAGRFLHYNDDGPQGLDALLSFTPASTRLYYAKVDGFGSRNAGSVTTTLTLLDQATATLQSAPPIEPGQIVRGAITEHSLLLVEPHDQTIYGNAYRFEGHSGQKATVRVVAGALGSRLDPQAFLLGPDGTVLARDDDGQGGEDSLLSAVLPADGAYYIVINRASGEPYGGEEDYYYEVILTIE